MMSRGRMLALASAMLIAGLVTLCFPSTRADAKATYPSPYTLGQTYSAALRLIRVDNGFKITERDPEAAYIMFDYESNESGSRVTPGAIEMVPAGDRILVLVKLQQMPRYHEEVLMTALKRKLESDYGEPPEKSKPKPPPPKEQPDAGADGSDPNEPSP